MLSLESRGKFMDIVIFVGSLPSIKLQISRDNISPIRFLDSNGFLTISLQFCRKHREHPHFFIDFVSSMKRHSMSFLYYFPNYASIFVNLSCFLSSSIIILPSLVTPIPWFLSIDQAADFLHDNVVFLITIEFSRIFYAFS